MLLAADRVVPFVGAGVCIPARLPAGQDLADWVRSLDEVKPVRIGAEVPLFETVDAVLAAGVLSESDLLDRLADYLDLSKRVFILTDALLKVARAASRVVLTLNYDLLIEAAADSQDIPAKTLTLEESDLAEATDAVLGRVADDVLRVIHVRGAITDPQAMVLSASSYRRQLERLRRLLIVLYTTKTICFVGTALDEVHLLEELAQLKPLRSDAVNKAPDTFYLTQFPLP